MDIYIVRHGETDMNKAGKLMGQKFDDGLNAEGISQAHELASTMKKGDFDIIFSSPLKRSIETAKIVAERVAAPIIERAEIIERDFGSLSGKTWIEMSELTSPPTDFRQLDLEQKYDYRPYGGESFGDVKERFMRLVEEIKNDWQGKKVLIVAHGGIAKSANFIFEGDFIRTPKNGAILKFTI